jgi:hypothetical protein
MAFIIHPHKLVSLLSPAPPATFSVLITHSRWATHERTDRDRGIGATQCNTFQPGASPMYNSDPINSHETVSKETNISILNVVRLHYRQFMKFICLNAAEKVPGHSEA